jgi:hypothetical protein
MNAPKVLFMDGKLLKYQLEYCYVSQRGYYPKELKKANILLFKQVNSKEKQTQWV